MPKQSNVNLPNVLTVLRIVLVPVFLVFLFWHPHDPAWRLGTTVVFALAILTDLADGRIARNRNQVTDFGKLWDPVADKALTGAAFVSLSLLGELAWWITIVILIREWGITALRAGIAKYAIMSANKGGKLKTVTQAIALVIYLLWMPALPVWLQWTGWVVMLAALAFTVVTGLDYLREAARLRRTAMEQQGTHSTNE